MKECFQESMLHEASHESWLNHGSSWSLTISLFDRNSFIAPNCCSFVAVRQMFQLSSRQADLYIEKRIARWTFHGNAFLWYIDFRGRRRKRRTGRYAAVKVWPADWPPDLCVLLPLSLFGTLCMCKEEKHYWVLGIGSCYNCAQGWLWPTKHHPVNARL